MSAAFGAILDANVLFPIALCDTLIRAALAGLYRAYWTAAILDEMERNLIAHERATAAQAQYRRRRMEAALPHAAVTGYGPLVAAMTNDPKDRHVLAAAVRAGARVIVTENLRDFPASACAPYDVEARNADAFLTALLDAAPAIMAEIIREQAADLRRPPQTPAQVLARLARTAPTFAREAYRLIYPPNARSLTTPTR
jgi:predicted nucleic acid-binding protein